MSEYWVSKKKYFCKYCDTYIADDVPSRQQHESGLRHKGNMERFIRSLYKAGEKRQKDLEEEKREILRVEKAAQAAYAQDISSGHATPNSTTTASALPVASSSKATSKKPTSAWTNYSTAESLGYHDPDAERSAADALLRHAQGVVGEWQAIVPTRKPDRNELRDDRGTLGVKRSAEMAAEEGPEAKLRKKTVSLGLGEIYDPGVIPVKTTKNEPTQEAKSDPESASTLTRPSPPQSGWTNSRWQTVDPLAENIKQEDDLRIAAAESVLDDVKQEPDLAESAEEIKPVFKKRRGPVDASRNRRPV
ncbi:hypothetical protein BDN72DRAFT_841505 [Pluteus cervinus]|uniref:Uncharacterized protein n=1 Tax=Pluteus cervinus TaxID=181527 RepID=A0ACD3ASL2_9AGAR|nr:hypothetical protein BDN72DRAFT_841505 [Pluteus cervinus]